MVFLNRVRVRLIGFLRTFTKLCKPQGVVANLKLVNQVICKAEVRNNCRLPHDFFSALSTPIDPTAYRCKPNLESTCFNSKRSEKAICDTLYASLRNKLLTQKQLSHCKIHSRLDEGC